MVNLSPRLSSINVRTFDQVPEKFKADVEEQVIEALATATNSDLIAER